MGWYWRDDHDRDYDSDHYKEDEVLGDREPTPDTILISGPVRATSRRGPIGVEWWGREWVSAFTHIGDSNRLARGRTYARKGAVMDLRISYGRAFARVSGSRASLYRSAVTLETFSDVEWERALAALAEQAIYSAKLLAGEMPSDIETLFNNIGLSLFPKSRTDLEFHCSCPDWGDPCKHAAAIYYLLAEQLDADPFTLFHLRGRSREQVLATLRAHRGVAAAGIDTGGDEAKTVTKAPPLDADLEAFWLPGGDLNLVRTAPTIPQAPPVLRLLGEPPGGVGAYLRGLYAFMSKEAYRWLGVNGNGNGENGNGK